MNVVPMPDTTRTPDVETRARQRLTELQSEYEKGQQTLRDLEQQAANLRATLLRISGALQVLQETLGEPTGDAGNNP